MEMAKEIEGRRDLLWTPGMLIAIILVGNHRLSAKHGSKELIGFMTPFMLKTGLPVR